MKRHPALDLQDCLKACSLLRASVAAPIVRQWWLLMVVLHGLAELSLPLAIGTCISPRVWKSCINWIMQLQQGVIAQICCGGQMAGLDYVTHSRDIHTISTAAR